MNAVLTNLFGDLPEFPPYQDQQADRSYCSNCSDCVREMKAHNLVKPSQPNICFINLSLAQINDKRIFKQMAEKKLFPSKPKRLGSAQPKNTKSQKNISRICTASNSNNNINGDINSEISHAIRNAREKHKAKNHSGNIKLEDPQAEEQIERKIQLHQIEAKSIATDQKYKQILRTKSEKAGLQNSKKKIVAINKKAADLREENRQMQQAAHIRLREEKLNYMKRINKLIFQLEKGKIIDQQKRFKASLQANASKARQEMETMEHRNRNNIQMLRDMLEEAKKQKEVNRVNQKQVLRQLEMELKEDQKRVHEFMEHKISSEVERIQSRNKSKYDEKLWNMKH